MARHVIRPEDRSPGFAILPKCHVCRRPASRGRDVCFRHAGRGHVHSLVNPHRRADRVLRQLEREELIPPDLARLEVWQRLRELRWRGASRAQELLERFCQKEIDPNGWIKSLRDATS
jgi:hypothetical protein